TDALLADGTIQENKLDLAVQTKLNQTAPTWTTLSGKPAVIAAGADQASARATIGAGTSSLTIGTTSSTAKAGDYTPTKADVGLANVDNTSDTNKPISTAAQTALNAKADNTGVVHLTGAETVAGVKTFSNAPIVPTPSGPTEVANKSYVDTGLATKQNTPIAPSGYIRVPGNSKFGTTDFFVMKYQAKNDGSNNAISVATGTPWVSISQRVAIDKSMAIGTNYHLITEPEWMTIATDILWVDSNWTGGTVGSGQLYRGHSDNNPANALDASTTDSNGYYGTGNSAADPVGSGKEQRRTLTLSNGEVIWDFAGNVWEWTDAWILGRDQPTVEASDDSAGTYFNYRQWTAINKRIGAMSYAMPTNRGWNTSQGLGQIYSRDDTATSNSNTTQYGFLRGGPWNDGTNAGVFALALSVGPAGTSAGIGFRVSRYL
ncbi:MAG: hypothetical protein WAW80_00805, partial [Candidatus Saccharimonadales bacterium]